MAVISKISILVTLFSIILGFFFMFMQMYENYEGYRTSEIKIGLTPFYINQPDETEDEYLIKLKSANHYLRDNHLPYRFAPIIAENRSYQEVIDNLKSGKINMAFLSMGLYSAMQNGYFGDIMGDKVGYDCQLIGFLKMDNNRVYYTGLVCKKGSFVDSILKNYGLKNSKFINNIKERNDSISLILGKDPFSTSTYLVPTNWLLEQGVNIREGYEPLTLNRRDLLDSIESNGKYVGFMNSEDFGRIECPRRHNYQFYEINKIPIPYDAVIVNRKWWNRRGENIQKELINALNRYAIRFINLVDTVENKQYSIVRNNVNNFSEYIYSGVVCLNKDSIYRVSIPNDEFAVFKFNDGDTVELFHYESSEHTNRSVFSPHKISLDTAIFRKKENESKLEKRKTAKILNISEGVHVIPINCNRKQH